MITQEHATDSEREILSAKLVRVEADLKASVSETERLRTQVKTLSAQLDAGSKGYTMLQVTLPQNLASIHCCDTHGVCRSKCVRLYRRWNKCGAS